ncbi:Lrp/AsnC family transcriptional regulator [Acidianus sp. HS-5]|uniref:Lrp/AsnC family transcriptional regulator n=1 Tax=Acidianus sp. HS-5 TaxID=2886040 RepID=UPI001F2D3BA3|nr:Lrp/AsnC family transcriptional regulator [Acidianus sp. HS-5]BDC18002.1 AsnC family transcriptional regulator [Acidianus sp. HS-5]
MDQINKKILFYLLKDYRTSQRSIAKMIGISSPAVNYRVDKLIQDKVIKRVSLYVNPNFYGKYHAYVAFKNQKDWDGEYVFKVNCLEETNIYEIEGNSLDDLKKRIDDMSENLGYPKMIYVPKQELYVPSNFDLKLVSIIKEEPTLDSMYLADRMKVSSKTIRRHIRYLYSRNFIRLIPEVDLTKLDLIMYAVFTHNVEVGRKFFAKQMFREISDDNSGIFVNVGDSLQEVKEEFFKFREFDKDADLMIAINYSVS